MSVSLKAKPQLMQKIEKAFNDTLYKDAIETSSNYNNRLIAERASRLPFIDLQTGVAQNNCTLWMNRWERMPGHNQGQIYSYPTRRWRKIRRSYLLNDIFSNKINLECNVSDKNEVIGASSGNSNDNCAIDYPTELENADSCEKYDPSKDNSGEPEESLPDISELADIDDPDTEEDDDNTPGTKKKTRKKYAKRKKASEYTDAEKPYICDLCGIKYKTRPGLSYHYAHSHANSNGESSSGSSNGQTAQNDYTSSRGKSGMDDMKTRSLVIIPSQSRPGISDPQSLPSYQGHIGNSHFREKINPTASSLNDQRSLPINYQLNQQPNFVLSPKYSTTGKSSTNINHDSDEGALEISNLSSNCRNILWPLYDPLFSSA
ncbi:zinc finger protein ubi-d4 [Tetranychus urticae]|nr:zinc finger protein ubi-d4 [Tetranychus urticae]